MADTDPVDVPEGLDLGGAALWADVARNNPTLTEVQKVHVLEACRMKDRLDRMNLILTGDASTWATLVIDLTGEVYDVRITSAVSKANETANAMKQLLAAARLPDSEGKIPQRRGARGAYNARVPGGAPAPTTGKDRRRDELAARRRAASSE